MLFAIGNPTTIKKSLSSYRDERLRVTTLLAANKAASSSGHNMMPVLV